MLAEYYHTEQAQSSAQLEKKQVDFKSLKKRERDKNEMMITKERGTVYIDLVLSGKCWNTIEINNSSMFISFTYGLVLSISLCNAFYIVPYIGNYIQSPLP